MKRRKFLKTSALAAGSVLASTYCKNKQEPAQETSFFESFNGSQKMPQGKLRIQYIREETPDFDIPAIRGTRYEDTVPDTLDIAERAKLGINSLTSITDTNADQEIYWLADFFRNPPTMVHNFNDWVQLVEGMMEALLLVRIATGSSLNQHIDPIWMKGMLKTIGPDGLVYVPMQGRPWSLVSVPRSYLNPVWRASGSPIGIQDPSVTQVGSVYTCQRALATMTLYYVHDKNPFWKSANEKMIQRLQELVVDKGDFAYFRNGGLEPHAKYGADMPMPLGFIAEESSARMIQGLAQFYRATGYDPAGKLAAKLARYIRFHAQYYAPDGRWLLGPDEKQWWIKRWKVQDLVYGGHGHAHALGLLSTLEYASVEGDKDLLAFVHGGYEWAKANSSSLVGFFPEAFLPGYDRCEADTIADMIAIALKLTKAGVGDYWDDADRWLRNHFSESQLTSVDWVYRLAEQSPRKPVAWNETGDRVPERNIGAFAGLSTGNDFNVYAPDHDSSIVHCCTGNSMRTLYYIWENMLGYDREALQIHLLMNRASAWADVYSHIPYQGRVDIKVKKPLKNIALRIPEWIRTSSPEVSVLVNGQKSYSHWEGRYLHLGSMPPGKVISVTFPTPEKEVKETIGNVPYTLRLKGNTVVSIDPPGKNGPLYQRNYYLAQQAPLRKVERFVPEEFVVW
ncbi:MAG: glycoside hydrolase family 127 protein [Terriglobia bacterium]